MNISEFESATEGMIFSSKDYVQNLDKWKPGSNNILYVTGLSGSGKSTIAKSYAKSHNAHILELDILQNTGCSSNDPVIKNVINNLRKDLPEYDNALKTFLKEKNIDEFNNNEFGIMKRATTHAIDLCKKDSKNLYVVEGIQLFEFYNKSNFVNKPLLIKGTSMVKSSIRGSKRDSLNDDGSVNKKEFISLLPSRLKWETEDELRLRKFKKK